MNTSRSVLLLLLIAMTLPTPGFAQCKDTGAATVSMMVDIGAGKSLGGDGQGTYINDFKNVEANLHDSANLWTTKKDHPVAKNPRLLVFNLSSPLVGSGAIPLGIVQDPRGEFHAFYKLDPVGTDGLRQIHSVQEIPNGATVQSQRTELWVRINGVQYLLIFGGDWPRNTCNSRGAVIISTGTTAGWITRTGDTWTTFSEPTGSIGRLWNYQDTFNPIDQGLYNFSFWAQFKKKSLK